MGLTTRVGVQTHHRPSNYDGPWLYFENYGNIAPPTARYLPNSYGILVFLLESRPQRRLRREARRRVGRRRVGERANGAEANRTDNTPLQLTLGSDRNFYISTGEALLLCYYSHWEALNS